MRGGPVGVHKGMFIYRRPGNWSLSSGGTRCARRGSGAAERPKNAPRELDNGSVDGWARQVGWSARSLRNSGARRSSKGPGPRGGRTGRQRQEEKCGRPAGASRTPSQNRLGASNEILYTSLAPARASLISFLFHHNLYIKILLFYNRALPPPRPAPNGRSRRSPFCASFFAL